MNKKLIIICIIIFSIVISALINQIALSLLLEKMIFNAVSILVGLTVAIIGIFLSAVNTVYLSIHRLTKTKNRVFTDEEIRAIKNGLSELVDELKENAIFSLYSFIIILLLFFFKEINIPFLKWFVESDLITKEYFVNTLILIGNFLIFWAIIDSVQVVFKITKAFELMKDE